MKRENLERAASLVCMLDRIDNVLTNAEIISFSLFDKDNNPVIIGSAMDQFIDDLHSQLLDLIKEYLRNEKQKAEQELTTL